MNLVSHQLHCIRRYVASAARACWFVRYSPVFVLLFVLGCGSSDSAIGARAIQTENELGRQVQKLGGRATLDLDFTWSDVTDEDLARMQLPDTVRSISLANTKITDQGLAALANLPNLEQLNLMNTQVTDEGLEQLKQLPHLWQVHLAGSQVSQEVALEFIRFLAPRAHEYHERAVRISAERGQDR
ncbi:MAG: leucine-rich repeat domain-containing protein [Pirellulales bacterium]